MHVFDPLKATATGLAKLLDDGELTSVDIIETFLEQIEKHNHAGANINALLATAPRHILLSQAIQLDEERAAGKLRSAFHGLPIIIKDNILTDVQFGMPTTAGSWAFVNAKARSNADLVKGLIEKGMLVIGKGNLTVRSWKTTKTGNKH